MVSDKVEMVPASALVENEKLYPRSQKDSTHIGDLANAIEAGENLPPTVVWRKNNWIADGAHTKDAYVRNADDPDVLVPVVYKDYANEKEFFADACERNSRHGRKLTSYDKIRCVVIGQTLRMSMKDIARILRMQKDKLDALQKARTAYGPSSPPSSPGEKTANGSSNSSTQAPSDGNTAKGPTGEPVVLKTTIGGMAGKELTLEQVEANEKLGGMRPVFYVNQVLLLVKADLMPRDNDKLTEALGELHARLAAWLGRA